MTIINKIYDELDRPLWEAPKRMNDIGVSGEVARRKLRSEAPRKILSEILQTEIGYPDTKLPPFTIIKG